MAHVILIGDSIFDNGTYIQPGEPDVTSQVNQLLSQGSLCTRLAIDGDVTSGVSSQLQSLPKDATHLFVSVGGNDALGCTNIFAHAVSNAGEALIQLNQVRDQFEAQYRPMLEQVVALGFPVTVCTIYYPRFEASGLYRVFPDGHGIDGDTFQQMAMAALTVFNDIILKQALSLKVPVIDLRVLCNDDQDFANPIEPSAIGGQKIAQAIVEMMDANGVHARKTIVYS